MDGWTEQERRMARKLGIPVANWFWWWRARHVLNSDERQRLEVFKDWLGREYAPDLAALRRRRAMHLVEKVTTRTAPAIAAGRVGVRSA